MLPRDIEKLILRLRERGISAFVVGGAVRDIITGKEPWDYDIAAECLPHELVSAFSDHSTIDIGLRFGTLTVHSGERNVEITCCRKESGYSDCRRPDSVEYCRSIENDLARRDFTMNAMAMTLEGEIIDPFGGRDDLKGSIIRCVGDPVRRFTEDALRITRALRFASCLGFKTEKKTEEALFRCLPLITEVSGERTFTELKKLLLGKDVLRVLMDYSSAVCTIIPELSRCVGFEQRNHHHVYTVYEHIARSVAASIPDINVRLCMLLHDVAKPQSFTVDEKGVGHFYGHPAVSESMAREILLRLKADRETVQKVCFLIRYHDTRPSATKKSIHKYLSKVGFENGLTLVDVRRADLSAQSPAYFDQFEYLDESERIIKELQSEGACISVQDLKISGNELIDLGIPRGREIGETLTRLLDSVITGQIENTPGDLMKLAKRIANDPGKRKHRP
ncbi:MAG: HD domain-containing protein [Clostridia bacterium]|nr:HD domain-containing protein [Clostridia bacterium]